MKPSNSALALTLGRVAHMLDWAYPPYPFSMRGKHLTMVVVVGGCVVFRKTQKKRTIPTWKFYGAIVFDSHQKANRG